MTPMEREYPAIVKWATHGTVPTEALRQELAAALAWASGEEHLMPTRWWRGVLEDGRLWVESSDEIEVREKAASDLAPGPVKVQRLMTTSPRQVWVDA